MVSYRIESEQRQNLEKATLAGEARKTYVWIDPDDKSKVVKIRKPNFMRRFRTSEDAINEVSQKDNERLVLIGILEKLGTKNPDKIIPQNTFVIYPSTKDTFEYFIEQSRVEGKTLDELRFRALEASPEILRELGRFVHANLLLHRQNKAIDLLGSLWPNNYNRLDLLIRPFVPICFSKNIMIGKMNDGEQLPWLVDAEIQDLNITNIETRKLSKKILLGSYISLLLIKARTRKSTFS